MDILPSTEMIQKIASIHFLQQQVGDRVDTLVGLQEEKQWQYEIIGKGMHTTTYRITLGKEKFALKISDNEKFTRDTELESWLRDEHGQNTPQIFSHGRGRLPGMEGEYFWSIQEYISGPRWRDSTMNDAQLDSYITQLGSLHQIKHNGTKGWGRIRTDHNGASGDLPTYVRKLMEQIDGCEFFDHQNRRKRVLSQVQVMQAKIGDATHREPVLIHNDAHVENVILDTEKTCRLLDYGNIKWSCPEQELAVIQTHCIGPRMGVFAQILEKYINRYPFDVDLFRLFVLIDASSKIGTRKKPEKQRFLWDTLVEPLLK